MTAVVEERIPEVVWAENAGDRHGLDWTDRPGFYVVRNANRSDRARLQRAARRHGLRMRTAWDDGRLLAEIDPLEATR